MRFEDFSFGSIRIDGVTYNYDVVIDRGEIRKRKKKPSKHFCNAFGHTLFQGGENTLEVPAAGDWHRRGSFAGHAGSETRGKAPEN
jgi:hypothetical protein